MSEKELNETEISNMPDKEFEVMTSKICTELEKRVEESSETFNKGTENINKKQS